METQQKPKGIFWGTRNNDGPPMKDFIPYEDAKRWVNRLGFENYKQWLRFSKMKYKKGPLRGRLIRPKFIPANPQCSYKIRGEWKNDVDFLGHNIYWKFDQAKQLALTLKLESSYEWRRWHQENNPLYIPRYPEFVYKDWELWADFLGSQYIHHSKRDALFIPYSEALQIVHLQRLESAEQYKIWAKNNPQYRLPLVPDGYYEHWEGWDKFLGKSVLDRIEVHQTVDTSVLYIAHHRHNPSNVYEIYIEKAGKIGVELKKARTKFQVVKMYAIQPTEYEPVRNIVKQNGTEWWESDHNFIIRNIYELLFQLDVLLYSI